MAAGRAAASWGWEPATDASCRQTGSRNKLCGRCFDRSIGFLSVCWLRCGNDHRSPAIWAISLNGQFAAPRRTPQAKTVLADWSFHRDDAGARGRTCPASARRSCAALPIGNTSLRTGRRRRCIADQPNWSADVGSYVATSAEQPIDARRRRFARVSFCQWFEYRCGYGQ